MNTENTTICLVTKNQSIESVERVLKENPQIKIIAENRWPDCEEKFHHFTKFEKHFIGHLQGNKANKVVPLVDMIQSVDSIKLLKRINKAAEELNKIMNFCFQVNISEDELKSGISPDELEKIIEEYKSSELKNVKLCGFMTMGEQADIEIRAKYYSKFKKLFDQINGKYFKEDPLKILSMGTSDDYKTAIENGSTMVRIGRVMFE